MTPPPEAEPSPLAVERATAESRSLRNVGDLQKAITMAQIAKAAGVSQGAISSLLNDRDYGIRVSEKTRERVFKVCREMGYIPNDLRAVVRMYPELGEFCLLIASTVSEGLNDPFVARLAHSAMASVREVSHPLTLATYEPDRDYSGSLDDLPYPLRSGVSSKFLFYGTPNPSLLQQIQRRGLPAVILGWDSHAPGVLSLSPDYVSASRIAVEHLLEHGHRTIGIVSGPFGTTASHVIELHQGIRAAFDGLKLPIEAQKIVYGDLSYRAGTVAFEEFWSQSVRPTAIFCLSDGAAAGVIARAHAHGVQVPQDLSVVGCGDDFCANIILPQLTTVHLPAEEMAAQGVREIDRMVREPLSGEARRQLVPVTLTERESTGPAPAAK